MSKAFEEWWALTGDHFAPMISMLGGQSHYEAIKALSSIAYHQGRIDGADGLREHLKDKLNLLTLRTPGSSREGHGL